MTAVRSWKQKLVDGEQTLAGQCPRMRTLIRRHGPCYWPRARDRFGTLVWSIVAQQISTAAARSIETRIRGLLSPGPVRPNELQSLPDEALRSAGLSPQKLRYVRDLCAATTDGRVQLPRIGRLSDDEVIAQLVQVHGIGRWTAEMFLIFSLGRLDVFPVDDLGVRMGVKRLFELPELPSKTETLELSGKWRPFGSIAAWHLWRQHDGPG